MSITQDYSGVIIDSNAAATDSLSPLTLSGGTQYTQVFTLPANYARGDVTATNPDLTGLQLFLNVSDAPTASVTWELDRFDGANWDNLASGTTTGTAQTGQSWFTVFFDAPVTILPTWLTSSFRIVVSTPNGVTAAYYNNNTAALMYRVLAAVADSGVDFLGNVYRSVAVNRSASNITPIVVNTASSYWLSQPSPSAFAVESMYLDIRDRGAGVVLDRFTLDPITPGVSFHLYYSSDPTGPGTSTASWENLLWTPVYQTFQANSKTTYALPEPITAQYLKVEFSNLQAQSYDPGDFQIPVTYKKYPQWVLDYFLVIFDLLKPDLLPSGVTINYDALDFGFNYYSGDLVQDPNPPALAQELLVPQVGFRQPEDVSDLGDPSSLAQITIAFQPYTSQPALMVSLNSVLGTYVANTATPNYSSEVINRALGNTSIVSNLRREALLVEKGFPIMFFFLPCRHAYRVAQAMFEKNIAYFAGVNSITFHRELHTGYDDRPQINEVLNDGANLLINDWVS